MLYGFEVHEVVSTIRLYVVEADSPEEALERAKIGDTDDEEDLKMGEVQDRFVAREMGPIDPDTYEPVKGFDPNVDLPESCECDNTHQANNTVCRWCWARGRRHWDDPEVQ